MDKESLQEFYQVCYEPPVGSESILFLGNTNAGKSTLINLFLGAKLTQITNKKKMNFSITIEKSDNPNMKFA